MPTADHHATLRRGDDVSANDVKRGRGARPRIDWSEAFAYFSSDGATTFAEVGAKFGVSDVSVGKHARKDNWLERRKALLDKAAERSALRTLDERNRRTLLLIDKARDHLSSDDADDPKWSDLAPLVKLEQLIEGEATDRVSVAEVSQFALELSRGLDQLVMRLVAEHLPNGKRRLFVEAWREGQGEVLDRSSAGLALEAGES